MKDLENAVITTGSGKHVRDTSQLTGEAKKTKAESATNSPVKYNDGKFPEVGALGGRNKRN